jgi:hypothetical protein
LSNRGKGWRIDNRNFLSRNAGHVAKHPRVGCVIRYPHNLFRDLELVNPTAGPLYIGEGLPPPTVGVGDLGDRG